MPTLPCLLALLAALVSVTPAVAQTSANPYSTMVKSGWDTLKKHLSASAAKVPEGDYAFRPTPQVRSFGQLFGHLANDHYLMCASAKGEKSPDATDYEKVTSKAQLVAALDKSIAYCDSVYVSMTDQAGSQPIDLFGTKSIRLAALQLNLSHSSEHYGNLITYMRLKGIVPPSSTQ